MQFPVTIPEYFVVVQSFSHRQGPLSSEQGYMSEASHSSVCGKHQLNLFSHDWHLCFWHLMFLYWACGTEAILKFFSNLHGFLRKNSICFNGRLLASVLSAPPHSVAFDQSDTNYLCHVPTGRANGTVQKETHPSALSNGAHCLWLWLPIGVN